MSQDNAHANSPVWWVRYAITAPDDVRARLVDFAPEAKGAEYVACCHMNGYEWYARLPTGQAPTARLVRLLPNRRRLFAIVGGQGALIDCEQRDLLMLTEQADLQSVIIPRDYPCILVSDERQLFIYDDTGELFASGACERIVLERWSAQRCEGKRLRQGSWRGFAFDLNGFTLVDLGPSAAPHPIDDA